MSVAWLPWGEAAFARARKSGHPVLLSLSAGWCGACHRMDEETWDDPGVTAVVERTTVPVRVDADERPDLYGRYHLGGLPSTAVLSPEGEFLRGGTFLSPTQLLGLLESARADLREGRRPSPRARVAPAPVAPLVTDMVERLRRRADREHGGFGAGAKLPEPEAVTLLLREWWRTGDAELAAIARESLDAIAAHLVDPADGGFFRYAAAADWSGPHTEKVTVDQAALIRLFLEASATFGSITYRAVAFRALEHARRRLADAEGRAYASVAAAPWDDVDRRRFADAGAALTQAWLLARELAGVDARLTLEAPRAAPDGAVPHWLDAPVGTTTPRGLLRDQALSIAAAVAMHRARGDVALLDWAIRAASWTFANLWDESRAAFRDASGGEGPVFTPLLANGEMAQALLSLAAASGDARWRRLAAQLVESLGAEAARSPAGAALALAAQELDRDSATT